MCHILYTGVAAAAYYNTKNDPNLGLIQPYVKSAVNATGNALTFIDEKTDISGKFTAATAGVSSKIKEFDEKHKIYENTSAVVSPIASKTREILEATPGKIVLAAQYTTDKAAEINQTYGITSKVGASIQYGLGVLEQVGD